MTLKGRIDTETYLTPYSDIVALLVFEHQAHMMNLLTRIGWEARVLAHESAPRSATALRAIAEEVVDYFLFADEVPLNGVRGTSGFAERFTGKGPRDRMGRSLRDLDLQERLLRYPFSYMIYSDAFDALPAAAKNANLSARVGSAVGRGTRAEVTYAYPERIAVPSSKSFAIPKGACQIIFFRGSRRQRHGALRASSFSRPLVPGLSVSVKLFAVDRDHGFNSGEGIRDLHSPRNVQDE